MGPHYLENFVQAIWNGIGGVEGKTLVLGGDGRYFNDRAAQVILRMAAASGAAKVIVGQGALLSTPAASNLIRERGTDGGIIMSASHNPGGPEEDFGVKYNTANGGPAPEEVTNRIFAETPRITRIPHRRGARRGPVARSERPRLGGMEIEVVDPVADYAALMERLFDFDAIRALFARGFTMRFDAMHAVTGPYATAILEGPARRAPGTRGERGAAPRLRRRPSRPEPDLGEGPHGPDDGPTARPISARPRTATATAT